MIPSTRPLSTTVPPWPAASPSPRWLAGIAKTVFALLVEWSRRDRERDALAALTGRELRDIGITRVDAAREFEKPFWRP
jgi:uncharacterized protein YjiS (DUF1127 family)